MKHTDVAESLKPVLENASWDLRAFMESLVKDTIVAPCDAFQRVSEIPIEAAKSMIDTNLGFSGNHITLDFSVSAERGRHDAAGGDVDSMNGDVAGNLRVLYERRTEEVLKTLRVPFEKDTSTLELDGKTTFLIDGRVLADRLEPVIRAGNKEVAISQFHTPDTCAPSTKPLYYEQSHPLRLSASERR